MTIAELQDGSAYELHVAPDGKLENLPFGIVPDIGRTVDDLRLWKTREEMEEEEEEIAEECGCDKATVSRVCCKPEDLPECNKPSAHHTDFDPPLYNVWKQQEKTPGSIGSNHACNCGT